MSLKVAPTPDEAGKKKKEGAAPRVEAAEGIVEIVSDAGEGAQRAGQAFGTLSAKMGNSIWTVEIIPAEIEPPPRSPAGASGNRIRFGSFPITNAGDQADLVVAFNEQSLWGRVVADSLKPGCTILLESMWATHADPEIVEAYNHVHEHLVAKQFNVIDVPMEEECLKHVSNARRGKNMFALGMLCHIYERDTEIARDLITTMFKKKGGKVIDSNLRLFDAGHAWARDNFETTTSVPPCEVEGDQIVVNGNTAIGLGVIASGMDVCAMYPITPATSASHYLCDVFDKAGGLVHQAEDEIAACGFAIGASYAGKCAVTITSGPGLALKTELLGLAAMAEIPLVVVDVQRGGPSTGLPTKVEQGDLLAAMFGTPGDAPKVVMAPATIEDCFYSVISARKIAEMFRMPVLVLSDANLATGQQPFARPKFNRDWLAPPFDQSPAELTRPYDWDPKTGLSQRFVPGRPGGMHTLTGLAHDRNSRVAYEPTINQEGCRHRSLKLAALQRTLATPEVFGDESGDLLLVGWGSTKGCIEEAVAHARMDGLDVSSLHLKFLLPMAPGIKEILQRFKRVVTVEINFSDSVEEELVGEDNRRYSNLCWLLRARCLVDVDCWSNVHGQPLRPGAVADMIQDKLRQPVP